MKFNDERLIFGSRISDRIIRDNNGQLICNDCILSRTGYYEYLESEIKHDGDPNKIVKVYRTEKEVFDPRSIASFENKPLCDDHPDEDVTLSNYKDLQKGFIRNVRRGTGKYQDCLLCDTIVTDEETIEKILSKEKRELSAGYDARIVKDEQGNYQMIDIRGNHLALVDSGRAGCATIRDSASRFTNHNGGRKEMSLFGEKPTTKRTRLFDGDIVEVEELTDDEDVVVEEPSAELEQEPVVTSDDDKYLELERRVAELEAKVATLIPSEDETVSDEEVEEVPTEEYSEEVEEVVADNDNEMEETEEDEYNDEDVEELIDADEVEEEEEEAEQKPVKDAKAKRIQSSYAKFANNLKDSKSSNQKSVQASFQERYNQAGR